MTGRIIQHVAHIAHVPQQIRYLGSALLWGMVEFLALQRARRQDGRRAKMPVGRRLRRLRG